MVARANNDTARPLVRDHRTTTVPGPVVRPPVVRPPVVRPPVAYVPRPSAAAVEMRDHRTYTVDRGATARSEFDGIMNNPRLSLEDKVMLLLFQVMKSMDNELLDKTKKLAEDRKNAVGPDGKKTTDEKKLAAVDEQTLELQQLQNTRNNMFAMLSAIVHKFDESTGKVIQKMGQ